MARIVLEQQKVYDQINRLFNYPLVCLEQGVEGGLPTLVG